MNFLYQHTTKTANGYFDEVAAEDLRSGDEFQKLTEKVLSHLKRYNTQTWRELSLIFSDRYKLGLAVEKLVSDNLIRLDETKPVTKIIFGGRETAKEVCEKIGHIPSRFKASTEVFCTRCQSGLKKNGSWA